MKELQHATTIGKISYTNAWPIYHFFEPAALTYPAELITEVPARLNERIQEGTLDLSAMSSFAYGMASDRLLLLPNISVSSQGEVKSILLFSKEPIDSIGNRTIALTNTSATSVNLLKVIMTKFYEGKPDYITMEPELEHMMENADAALLIGDHAIKASWADHHYFVYDLGELWYQYTGHSMTYAVWAVSRSLADNNGEAVQEIVQAFYNSKTASLRDLAPVVKQAIQQIGGSEAYWYAYFRNLVYDFGENELQGLQLYFRYAHELGLMEHEVQVDLWNENKLIRVTE
ncbi:MULTISPECIES: menaquinone biosynthesis protein [unclassified Paenibacillus]|uniref:Chorismate dehydratase n=1 Tax=Paenibacillus provencensis TaxID=441151 RepID=A0ABW3PS78_9BACL|nr:MULTISPECIES: menaquinone biosynthesis protein [unclassified Paenibacillus]MCM3126557.1 menaquinone biosynthesis protein [Paenibacillus sp. MER 78]SFS59315.1 futalosine synthase [Paenibacillus sp. 453mf]